MEWEQEIDLIYTIANAHGVDPLFIAAIRKGENGPKGKEFGVLLDSCVGFTDQCSVACKSVRHRLLAFQGNPFRAYQAPHNTRLGYVYDFIKEFAAIWAPLNVANDPHNLNANWPLNVSSIYREFIEEEA